MGPVADRVDGRGEDRVEDWVDGPVADRVDGRGEDRVDNREGDTDEVDYGNIE